MILHGGYDTLSYNTGILFASFPVFAITLVFMVILSSEALSIISIARANFLPPMWGEVLSTTGIQRDKTMCWICWI